MINFTRWFKGFGADNELRFEFEKLKKEYTELTTTYRRLSSSIGADVQLNIEGLEEEIELLREKVCSQENEYALLKKKYEDSVVKIKELEYSLSDESINKKASRRKKSE
jgi:predicted  nucleic acid-binding Zn-ribbon protein